MSEPKQTPHGAMFGTPIRTLVDALEPGRPGAAMLLNTVANMIAINRVPDGELLALARTLTSGAVKDMAKWKAEIAAGEKGETE